MSSPTINFSDDIDYEEEELDNVGNGVAAEDLLALWTKSCCHVPFTSPASEGPRDSSQDTFHVSVDGDGDDRSNVLVTYGSGDVATDTCIFSLDGKLSFVAVSEVDVVRARRRRIDRLTRNDQYYISIDITRAGSDAVEKNLNHIFSKASKGATGQLLAENAGLKSVSCDSFITSWRADTQLYIRNAVARPYKNFSKMREFSVPKSSVDWIKPPTFVYGPAPLFYDEDGKYILPENVRAQAHKKAVSVMLTIDISPSPMGKIFCNLEVLSVRIQSSVEFDSPSKKRRLQLGI